MIHVPLMLGIPIATAITVKLIGFIRFKWDILIGYLTLCIDSQSEPWRRCRNLLFQVDILPLCCTSIEPNYWSYDFIIHMRLKWWVMFTYIQSRAPRVNTIQRKRAQADDQSDHTLQVLTGRSTTAPPPQSGSATYLCILFNTNIRKKRVHYMKWKFWKMAHCLLSNRKAARTFESGRASSTSIGSITWWWILVNEFFVTNFVVSHIKLRNRRRIGWMEGVVCLLSALL